MALSRLYTFVAGQTILASEVNAEFNQLINFLNGTVLADATMKNSAAGTPTLTLDHTGGGKPLSVKVGGNAGVEVNNLRQLVLTPVAGNQPIVLSVGAVKVNYLDADKLDGLEAIAFLRANQPLAWVEHANGASVGFKIPGDTQGYVVGALNEDSFFLSRQAVESTEPSYLSRIFEHDNINSRFLFFGGVRGDGTAPTDADDLTPKAYVDAKTSDWAFGAFYDGVVATATRQPTYISPSAKMTLLKLRASYRSGTPTGPTTIKLGRYNSTGTLVQEWTITIPQAQAVDTVVTANVATNNVLAENDQLRWTVTVAGAHADITVFVTGTEGLL